MRPRVQLVLATLAFSGVAFAQTVGPDDAFQVRYASNLNIGDSVVNVTNTGTSGTAGAFGQISGNICVNVYTFDPAEELISCCACNVTPNGLQSLSVRGSLTSNPLTPAIPTSVVIKLLASDAGAGCNASAPGALVSGMRAWGTTLHALPTSPVSYGVTETAFSNGGLSAAELAHLTTFCGFIQANGSGFGICSGCSTGGLGAAKE
jgi:hypothetical protein